MWKDPKQPGRLIIAIASWKFEEIKCQLDSLSSSVVNMATPPSPQRFVWITLFCCFAKHYHLGGLLTFLIVSFAPLICFKLRFYHILLGLFLFFYSTPAVYLTFVDVLICFKVFDCAYCL